MALEESVPRSRRALLTAAAGAAGALAASAALPAVVSAHDADDVQKGVDNATTATTIVTDSADGQHGPRRARDGHRVRLRRGRDLDQRRRRVRLEHQHGVGWDPPFDPSFLTYTGVFGFAPQGDGVTTYGSGVWGDSPDTGVFGTGSYGVEGVGGVGVAGYANGQTGSIGVHAWSDTNSATALRVDGKVHLSRSGRKSMSSGKSNVVVTLAGVTSSSKVFAVLATSESGRYVRAVVPASGKFTVYLNTSLSSSASVSWFVLD